MLNISEGLINRTLEDVCLRVDWDQYNVWYWDICKDKEEILREIQKLLVPGGGYEVIAR